MTERQFASMAEKRRFDESIKRSLIAQQAEARDAFFEADYHREHGLLNRAVQWQESMAEMHRRSKVNMWRLLYTGA